MPKEIRVYQQIEESINGDDGTFNRNTKYASRMITGSSEPEYVRVYKYLNVVFAYENIPLTLVAPMIEISKYMSGAESGQLVTMNKIMREEICKTLGITINRLNQIVRELRNADLLRDTESRGTYAVNPFIVSAGKSTDVATLQAEFDFNAEILTVRKVTKNLITGRAVRQAITENKKKLAQKKVGQIPGQYEMTFDENREIREVKEIEGKADERKTDTNT